ncbi:autophagy-related protein 22-like protein [Polychytrium aggregatum]|uniref:autophagy-related protein 22-like protein n=1 Tax=Polychytrium aggregatum TaxID=110093 RepID=UPI0022FEE6F5|nr:autophagy-related protein 22-like protein [Polychytrium aggregatum]KAI9204320.1 autophagy-related protein 22-like protein [Polychytrium aggregatum]
MPVVVRGLAAESGWNLLDNSVPCDITAASYSCCVKIGSGCLDTGSLFLYLSSAATILQMFVLIGFGALSDYGEKRKRWMIIFSILSCFCGLAFVLVLKAALFWIAGLLFIAGSVLFVGSYLFFFAYIPVLTRAHPDYLSLSTTVGADVAYDRTANRISSTAVAFGYGGTLVTLAIGSAIIYLLGSNPAMPTSTYPSQIVVAFSSVWWLGFLWFPAAWLKSRPGPCLPAEVNPLTYSFKKVGKTLRKAARDERHIIFFLLGWVLYADAFNTLLSVALLIAQEELGASQLELVGIALTIFVAGIVGLKAFPWIQNLTKRSTKPILIAQASLYALLTLYGVFFLKHKWEIWVCAVWHGLLIGATQSSCRVWYSQMIPPGQEAEYFSMMTITDKGSSAIGPLIVGAIIQGTGYRRNSLWFLLGSFIVAGALFFSVQHVSSEDERAEQVESPKSAAMKG